MIKIYNKFVVFVLLSSVSSVFSNPTDPQIAHGNVSIYKQGNNALHVAASDKSIVNWQNFSIKANEITKFIQPSASAAVLNRVVGQNISEILGTLEANGHVYLINPSGIIFGKDAIVNTAAFTASTLDVLDESFFKDHQLTFTGETKAKIINHGNIIATIGDVALLSYQVENLGSIKASNGNASIICAEQILLSPKDGNKFLIKTKKIDGETDVGILNKGNIEAIKVELQADGNPYALAIKHKGTINSFDLEKKDGRVLIIAQEGTSHITGSITCKNEDGTGGEVQLLGKNVGVFEKAKIDVSAKNGQGVVLVGGDFQGQNSAIPNSEAIFIGPEVEISADCLEEGNGGKIICWSNEATKFYGTVSAKGGKVLGDGGLIEISGKSLDYKPAIPPSTSAVNGKTGQLLLDPTNVIISAAATVPGTFTPAPNFSPLVPAVSQNLDVVDVQNSLLANHTTISTIADVGGGGGNITISTPLVWNTANNLIMDTSAVNGTINVNSTITSNVNGGSLLLTSGNGTITVASAITTNGAGNLVFYSVNGKIDVNSTVSSTNTGQITFNSSGTGDINVNNSVLSTGSGDINFTINDGTISINNSTSGVPVDVQTNTANINVTNTGTAATNCLEVHGGNALNTYGKVEVQNTGDLIINANGRSILLEPGAATFTYAYLHNTGSGEIRINNCLDLSLKAKINDNSNILVTNNQFVYTGTGHLHLDATGGGPNIPILIKAASIDIDSNQITLDGGDNAGGNNRAYFESTSGIIDLRTTGSVILNGGTASTTNSAYILSAGMLQSGGLGSLSLFAQDSNCFFQSNGMLLLNVHGDVILQGGTTTGSAYFVTGAGNPQFSVAAGNDFILNAGTGTGTSAYISNYSFGTVSGRNIIIRGGPSGTNNSAFISGPATFNSLLRGGSISFIGGISPAFTNSAYFHTTSGTNLTIEATNGNISLTGGKHINNAAYIQVDTANVTILSSGNLQLIADLSSAKINAPNLFQIGSSSSPIGTLSLTGGHNGAGFSEAVIDSSVNLSIYCGNIQMLGGSNFNNNGAYLQTTGSLNIPIAGDISLQANQVQAGILSNGDLTIGSLANPIGTLTMLGGSGAGSSIPRLQSILGRLSLYARDANVTAGIGAATNTAEIWSGLEMNLNFQGLVRFIGSAAAHVDLWAIDGPITLETQDTFRFIGDVLVHNGGVGPHEILAIAGNDISLESNFGLDPLFDNTTNGGAVTFVVDNLYPDPGVGSGAFLFQAGNLQTNNGPIKVYTSTRELNTITGTFNGANYIAGPEFVDSATEMWNHWYPNSPGGFPYTIYYKKLVLEAHNAMDRAFSAFAEMKRDLHNFHEYTGRYLTFEKMHEKRSGFIRSLKDKFVKFSTGKKDKIPENVKSVKYFLRQRDQERRYPENEL